MYNNVHGTSMKNSKNTSNSPIQLQVALIPVCKMVIRFGMHFNEFVRNLQKAYIHAAEDILQQSNIKANLQAIAIKTGMDRRTISEHKNNSNMAYSNPMNKMDMLIVQLQRYCAKTDKKSIQLTMMQTIIDSIYAQHIRSKAIIKELLANKIIIQITSDTYKLNLTLQQQLKDIKMMADDVDFTAKRLFQTYYKNMFERESSKTIELLQKSCLSTKVPSSRHKKVIQLLNEELKTSSQRMNAIIEQYESNVPENTYPELGVTQFQFSSIE